MYVREIVDYLKDNAVGCNSSAFAYIRENGGQLSFNCPYHQESTPSCVLEVKEPFRFHCFGCGNKGTIEKLVSDILCLSPIKTQLFLARYGNRNFNQGIKVKSPITSEDTMTVDTDYKKYTCRIPNYFFQRGFSRESSIVFGVGYDAESNSLTLPVVDDKGRVAYIQRRRIPPFSGGKYLNEKGVPRNKVLYGLFQSRYLNLLDKPLFLVEGALDAISIVQCGYPACALLSKSLSDYQAKLLTKYKIKEVIVLMDGDDAGRSAVPGIVGKLNQNYIKNRVVIAEDGAKDPNELLQQGSLSEHLRSWHGASK